MAGWKVSKTVAMRVAWRVAMLDDKRAVKSVAQRVV